MRTPWSALTRSWSVQPTTTKAMWYNLLQCSEAAIGHAGHLWFKHYSAHNYTHNAKTPFSFFFAGDYIFSCTVKERDRTPPTVGCGHTATLSPPSLHPVRILTRIKQRKPHFIQFLTHKERIVSEKNIRIGLRFNFQIFKTDPYHSRFSNSAKVLWILLNYNTNYYIWTWKWHIWCLND